MKGSHCKLIQYMEGSSKHFVIPVYQRNYEWKTENCKQLFNDLLKIIQDKRQSHFFGAIVFAYNPSGQQYTEYSVIDGQQRLTTISLLFLAMYNLISKGIIISENPMLATRIYEEFLVDKYQPEEMRIKLKSVKNDQSAFRKLFGDEREYIQESNLTINYKCFCDLIQSHQNDISIVELFDAICKLEIINIELENNDNPQLIFESLNSTGLELSEGDKIRNFILMGLPVNLQETYYNNYWNKIEECTNYDVSAYIRDYLSVKQQQITSQKYIYVNFKKYVEESSIQIEELLKELLDYAKRYKVLLNSGSESRTVDACIYRLNRLETTVTRPFFLEVLRLFEEDKLNMFAVTEIFLVTENYLFRRNICDLPTNSLNKIFLMLHHEIMRYDGTENNYVEKFKYTLLSKKEKARFPDNFEFSKAFTERQIYLMNSKNKIYIMERLENFGTKEDKDIYRHCDEGDYSIEHIMPQHLTPIWIKELGKDYEQIHQVWLHRIANLTLTAYNSSYSNSSFYEKKTKQNGYDESGIRMNMYISKKDKWTLEELEERSEYLLKRALTIWSLPITDYQPEKKQFDTYTLEDIEELSGRIIAKFSYKNVEQPVISWVEMYQKVLQILYDEDRTILIKLAASKGEDIATHFSMKPIFSKSIEIGDGIFVWTNTNTRSKLAVLSRVFKLYGIDSTDLIFQLREDKDVLKENITIKEEKRRRYWAYVLELIRNTYKVDTFNNVIPSKGNWINGFVGIDGFNICCVANTYSARVEFVFGKKDKNKNKIAFENLKIYKDEIEAKLGKKLTWKRNDDIKSSRVYYQLDNVSIENENDWLKMAHFHSEWSKKFYEVILPYLR